MIAALKTLSAPTGHPKDSPTLTTAVFNAIAKAISIAYRAAEPQKSLSSNERRKRGSVGAKKA